MLLCNIKYNGNPNWSIKRWLFVYCITILYIALQSFLLEFLSGHPLLSATPLPVKTMADVAAAAREAPAPKTPDPNRA